MTIDFLINELSAYILVFCRMGGMIFFNPILLRRNLPAQFKIALVLGLSILVTPTIALPQMTALTEFVFIWIMIKEVLIGIVCGYVFQFFYYMLFTAGDIIDMGFGLSMAKAFDPGTNIQISMSGNFFQFLFVIYVFVTNSHLVFIELAVSSYNVLGVGAATFGANVGQFMMTLFSSVFLLSMQLALPFIAAAFIMEIAMGILMKLIPQINVFALHFQIKIIVGIVLLFLFAEPVSIFMREYINILFLKMQDVFVILA